MKKLSLVLIVAVLIPASLMAGGIVTNTNQSASFIRMPSRDASLGLDATYFNPAGLVFLKDGFHLSINNQTISQTRKISSTNLKRTEFEGKVSAPLFPSIYAVYKKDKFAYSLGIMPIGGGGSAGFETGLPSFEYQVAVLPRMLTASGIPTNDYDVNANFEGTSLNWGFQFNASYAINDMFSLSLGTRIVTAKNSYEGYLKDLKINPNQPAFGAAYNGTSLVSAPQFFTDAATTLTGWSAGATSFAGALSGIIAGGGDGTTLISDGANVGLNATQIAQIQGLVTAAGQNPATMNIQTAQAVLAAAAPVFSANAAIMTANSAATSDKEIKAEQSGMGIAPVIGLNINLAENVNISLKYEFLTSLTMTNKTTKDDVNMYPDGAKSPNDMPAMLSFGFGVKPIEKLNFTGGFHIYFDKGANYGKKLKGVYVENEKVINKNFWEAAFGAEYEITSKILVSAGYLRTQTGVTSDFQSDLSHSLTTNSIGFGGRYMIMDNLGLNLGFMKTMYEGYSKIFTGYQATFNREATVIAVGFDYSF
jgi:long-subunit fatty acid transport protein